MKKRLLSLLLVATMVFALVACSSSTSGDKKEEKSNYKIGIVTGTVSQGEEEYQMAQDLQKKWKKQ